MGKDVVLACHDCEALSESSVLERMRLTMPIHMHPDIREWFLIMIDVERIERNGPVGSPSDVTFDEIHMPRSPCFLGKRELNSVSTVKGSTTRPSAIFLSIHCPVDICLCHGELEGTLGV